MAIKSLFLTEKIGYPGKNDTNLLISESVRRFETFAFEPQKLFVDSGRVKAKCHKVSLDKNSLSQSEQIEIVDISENCVVTIRLNPPFDSRYLTAMHMLAAANGNSYIVNNPRGIINIPEKFIPANLQEFTPPTLMTQDMSLITDFWHEHGDIIIKPIYEFGGRGVFRLQKKDENFKSIFQLLSERYNEPLIAQKYIPEVKTGDKRIGLLDGEVNGYFLRVPPEGQIQAAIIQGGSFIKCDLTEREHEICRRLKPFLAENDIFFCGIDIIGDYLTEINVTCPAIFYCLNELQKNDHGYIASEIIYWDRLETKLKSLNIL